MLETNSVDRVSEKTFNAIKSAIATFDYTIKLARQWKALGADIIPLSFTDEGERSMKEVVDILSKVQGPVQADLSSKQWYQEPEFAEHRWRINPDKPEELECAEIKDGKRTNPGFDTISLREYIKNGDLVPCDPPPVYIEKPKLETTGKVWYAAGPLFKLCVMGTEVKCWEVNAKKYISTSYNLANLQEMLENNQISICDPPPVYVEKPKLDTTGNVWYQATSRYKWCVAGTEVKCWNVKDEKYSSETYNLAELQEVLEKNAISICDPPVFSKPTRYILKGDLTMQWYIEDGKVYFDGHRIKHRQSCYTEDEFRKAIACGDMKELK